MVKFKFLAHLSVDNLAHPVGKVIWGLYGLFSAIIKPSDGNTIHVIYNIWRKKTNNKNIHWDPNKLASVKRYIINSNRSTNTKKDYPKEQLTVDIQRNETVVLEMNAVNNETVYI